MLDREETAGQWNVVNKYVENEQQKKIDLGTVQHSKAAQMETQKDSLYLYHESWLQISWTQTWVNRIGPLWMSFWARPK